MIGSSVGTRPVAAARRAAAAAIALAVAGVMGLPGRASAHDAPAPAIPLPATPALSSQASASGLPVGMPVFDTATLGFGRDPTGSITFSLFDRTDSACAGGPIFTSTVPVVGNGDYTSASVVIHVAGTYRWIARYSGDADNNPATSLCSNSGAAVAVAKRNPTLSGAASPVDASGALTDTATVNGGGPSGPTGTVTFRVFGPGNSVCSGPPVFTSTKPVSGSGSYLSDAFRAATGGVYQWVVTYSGDANNNAAGTVCTDPANTVQVPGGTSVTASPGSLRGSETLTVAWSGIPAPSTSDWVGLYPAGGSTVKVWKYLNTATGSGTTTLRVPFGTIGGAYEVRLLSNGTTTVLATAPVTVL